MQDIAAIVSDLMYVRGRKQLGQKGPRQQQRCAPGLHPGGAAGLLAAALAGLLGSPQGQCLHHSRGFRMSGVESENVFPGKVQGGAH